MFDVIKVVLLVVRLADHQNSLAQHIGRECGGTLGWVKVGERDAR